MCIFLWVFIIYHVNKGTCVQSKTLITSQIQKVTYGMRILMFYPCTDLPPTCVVWLLPLCVHVFLVSRCLNAFMCPMFWIHGVFIYDIWWSGTEKCQVRYCFEPLGPMLVHIQDSELKCHHWPGWPKHFPESSNGSNTLWSTAGGSSSLPSSSAAEFYVVRTSAKTFGFLTHHLLVKGYRSQHR